MGHFMKGLKILAVVLVVGAVIVATVVVHNFIGGKYDLRQPPAGPPRAANAPRVVHRLEIPNVKPREFRVIGPASALALNTREPEAVSGESNCSLLPRELARQAVLIAARDGV